MESQLHEITTKFSMSQVTIRKGFLHKISIHRKSIFPFELTRLCLIKLNLTVTRISSSEEMHLAQ